MKRLAIILLLTLTCACATIRRAAAQSEFSSPVRAEYDSLTLDDMAPLYMPVPVPHNLSARPLWKPSGMPFDNRFDDPREFSAPSLRVPSLPFPEPFEFVMPGRDLFIAHDRFRRLEGITIPAASVNSPRMVLSASGYMPLTGGENHALGLTGSRQRYPSMGFSNSLTAGYSWSPTDGITLYGNLRLSDNMYHLNRFKDISVSGRARVRVTDGLWINGYGNYTLYNNAGPQQMPMGLFPTNSYGGTIEVRITDGFGIEGGVMREYDPFRRRWVTNPYVMPVFY